MKTIMLRDEPDFVKVLMKTYADGSLKFVVKRKYAGNEEFYLMPEEVEVLKQNL